MKEIDKLLQNRNSKINELKAVQEAAKDRAFSADEKTKIEAIKNDIADVDQKIEIQNTLDLENSNSVKKEFSKDEKNLNKELNIFKAISDYVAGKQQTGAEKEAIEEGIKELKNSGAGNYDDAIVIPTFILSQNATTTSSDLTHTKQANDLSVHNSELVINRLGVRVYEGLNGKFDVPSMSELTATYADEDSTQDDITISDSKATLNPRFLPATHSFTREYLNQTSPSVQAQQLAQFQFALDRAEELALFTELSGLTAMSGYSGSLTGMTWTDLIKMQSEVNFGNAYVTNRKLMAYLKTKSTDTGSGRFVWQNDMIDGYNAFASNQVYDNQIYFGDWKEAAIGRWGGLIILRDPFSNKRKGLIDIQIARISDVEVVNSAAFAVIKNAAHTA